MKTYKLIKDVIESKNFKMAEMTEKIKKCWIEGDITEAERNVLLSMLPSYLNADAERPEWIEVAAKLSDKVKELELRIITLEGNEIETPKYEKWEAWNGDPKNKKYQFGAMVEHNGVVWENTLEGQQNVWEPGVPGTELLWKVYTE